MSSTLSSHPTLTPNLNTTLRPNATPSPSISLARSLAKLNYDSILSIEPFQLFLAQLDTGNTETRVDAMRRCFVVANAMGRDATINQLIPFLANHVNKKGEMAAVTQSPPRHLSDEEKAAWIIPASVSNWKVRADRSIKIQSLTVAESQRLHHTSR